MRPKGDVRRLTTNGAGGRFRLETTQGDLVADEVVVATGSFHTPRIPPVATELPERITQRHSHAYRNERGLLPGAVLIVGSGQSGCQIAEELVDAGRQVYISVGSAGRAPRRYRRRDIFRWLAMLATEGRYFGVTLPTVGQLRGRLGCLWWASPSRQRSWRSRCARYATRSSIGSTLVGPNRPAGAKRAYARGRLSWAPWASAGASGGLEPEPRRPSSHI